MNCEYYKIHARGPKHYLTMYNTIQLKTEQVDSLKKLFKRHFSVYLHYFKVWKFVCEKDQFYSFENAYYAGYHITLSGKKWRLELTEHKSDKNVRVQIIFNAIFQANECKIRRNVKYFDFRCGLFLEVLTVVNICATKSFQIDALSNGDPIVARGTISRILIKRKEAGLSSQSFNTEANFGRKNFNLTTQKAKNLSQIKVSINFQFSQY